MQNAKAILIVVLGILALTLIVQNHEPVPTDILFWTVTMPRWALIVMALIIGFTLGALTLMFGGSRRKSPPAQRL
jgi:uncharacterized integral membrane protein